jgi:hypothetical protein
LIIVTITLVWGCSRPPTVSESDVSIVLTMAAQESERKLPKSYCVKARMEPSGVIWPKQTESGEWVDAPNEKNLKYRKIVGPDVQRLPESALRLFGEARVEKPCRHLLSFHRPVFIQYRTLSGTYLEAGVSISDVCPVCGGGYEIRFRKTERSWVIQNPGISSTWLS